MNKSTEYKGFTIIDCGWGFRVYGTTMETFKYGFVRNFETIVEAMNFIDELFEK